MRSSLIETQSVPLQGVHWGHLLLLRRDDLRRGGDTRPLFENHDAIFHPSAAQLHPEFASAAGNHPLSKASVAQI